MVPGFTIYRRERLSKGGGVIMVFVNQDVKVKQRIDLVSQEIEVIWREIYPFKSKRSIIIRSIYRPPSSKKADDLSIEANIERVHLLNKETVIVGDINIDYREKTGYNKHRLVKGLSSMHFKQLVDFITRPISKTCLSHMYCSQPHQIKLVTSRDIGLSDHLPVFFMRKYAHENRSNNNTHIQYRDIKHFKEEEFKQSLQ